MRGVQRTMLRALVDWLVERGSLTLFDEDGSVDPNSAKSAEAREELVQTFLAERGASAWPKAPTS